MPFPLIQEDTHSLTSPPRLDILQIIGTLLDFKGCPAIGKTQKRKFLIDQGIDAMFLPDVFNWRF